MKTVAAVLVVAAITAGGSWAGGAHFASSAQVKSLGSRVTALEKKTASLQKGESALLEYVGGCFASWAPITRYGDPNGSAGYVYQNTGGSAFLTTGLDVTGQNSTPSFFVPAPSSDCSVKGAKFRALERSGVLSTPRFRAALGNVLQK
jgi:hypothetical protein